MSPFHLPTEISEEVPPLFHYTDAGGLLGMLQKQVLWMTNVHYQNDEQEYRYAFELLRDIVNNRYAGELPGVPSDSIPMGPFYSFSLSEERDLLSQWRGYCPNGGYAISFNREQLNAAMKASNLSIGKCIYDRAAQEELIINEVIGFTPDAYTEAKGFKEKRVDYKMPANMDHSYLRTSRRITERIISIAPLLKHPSFSEEKEWRLIGSSVATQIDIASLPLSVYSRSYKQSMDISFRVRKNILIPYLEIPLMLEDKKPIAVSEVVVGPTPHKMLALESCKVLMHASGYSQSPFAKVENSVIPYVNW